jgi:hypothetical protein
MQAYQNQLESLTVKHKYASICKMRFNNHFIAYSFTAKDIAIKRMNKFFKLRAEV